MPKTKTAPRYKVLNPNEIPPGVPILSWRDRDWYVGDILEPPPGMSVERILGEGYIVEVNDG